MEELVEEIKTHLVADACGIVWQYAVDVSRSGQYAAAVAAGDVQWLSSLERMHHMGEPRRLPVVRGFYRLVSLELMRIACENEHKDAIAWMLKQFRPWKNGTLHPKEELLGKFVMVPCRRNPSKQSRNWERGMCGSNYHLREWLLTTLDEMEKKGSLPIREYSFEDDFEKTCVTDGVHSILWFVKASTERGITLDCAEGLNAMTEYSYDPIAIENIRKYKNLSFIFMSNPNFEDFVISFNLDVVGGLYDDSDPEEGEISQRRLEPWLNALYQLKNQKADYGNYLEKAFQDLCACGWATETKLEQEPFDQESRDAYTRAVLHILERNVTSGLNEPFMRPNYLPVPGRHDVDHMLVLRTAVAFGGKQIAEQCQKRFGITIAPHELPPMLDPEHDLVD